jgi:predicted permease
MYGVFQDARYGLRTLAKSPGFTAVAVFTLALGIGANTAIFAVFDAMLLRLLPVPEPEKLLLVNHMVNGRFDNHSYPVFDQLRQRQQSLAGLFAAAGQQTIYQASVNRAGTPQALDRVYVGLVSGEYFSVLGVQPATGRFFTPDEDRVPGGHPVVVISHGFWDRQFGRSSDAVGSRIQLRDTVFTIIGVTRPGFFGEAVGDSPDLWTPLMMQPLLQPENLLEATNLVWLKMFGRLKPGVGNEQAEAELTVALQQVMAGILGESPSNNRRPTDYTIQLESGAQGWGGWRRQFSNPLWVLMGLVSLVLLIACCNIANLLLSRATGRHREIAIRLAVGCGRWRLVRQLLTESLLLALLGGALGLYLAWFGSDALVQLLTDPGDPMLLEPRIDARVLGFTLGASLLASVVFGLMPALRTTSLHLDAALKPARGIGQGRAQQRLTRALVAAQVAVSLFLLVVAGLLVRSVQNLYALDPGFDRHNVLLVDVHESFFSKVSPQLYRAVEDRLRALPGVQTASVSAFGLMQSGGWTTNATSPGFQGGEGGFVNAPANSVSPSYFETVGMRLALGRAFEWRDTKEAPKVAIVNEKMARELFGDENPVGKLVALRKEYDPTQAAEIVGVVEDAKYNNLREEAQNNVYLPLTQTEFAFLSVELRTAGDPQALTAQARQLLREEGVLVREVKTLEEQTSRTLLQERMMAKLAGFFGLVALTLASIGLYGVLSTAVSRRTNEIGLRLALGARPGDVLRLWLREAGLLIAAGIALGLPAALAATRWIESFLFGLTPADPLTIAAAIAVLGGVAALAAYLPARRAANLDPIEALRYE